MDHIHDIQHISLYISEKDNEALLQHMFSDKEKVRYNEYPIFCEVTIIVYDGNQE